MVSINKIWTFWFRYFFFVKIKQFIHPRLYYIPKKVLWNLYLSCKYDQLFSEMRYFPYDLPSIAKYRSMFKILIGSMLRRWGEKYPTELRQMKSQSGQRVAGAGLWIPMTSSKRRSGGCIVRPRRGERVSCHGIVHRRLLSSLSTPFRPVGRPRNAFSHIIYRYDNHERRSSLSPCVYVIALPRSRSRRKEGMRAEKRHYTPTERTFYTRQWCQTCRHLIIWYGYFLFFF